MKMDELETIFKNVKKRYDKRKQEKFNKKTRCPWCGEILRHDASCPTKANFGTKRCQKCGGCSKPEDSLTDSLLDFEKLILYILGIISYRNIFWFIIFLMIFVFVMFGSSFFYRYVTYKRLKGY